MKTTLSNFGITFVESVALDFFSFLSLVHFAITLFYFPQSIIIIIKVGNEEEAKAPKKRTHT